MAKEFVPLLHHFATPPVVSSPTPELLDARTPPPPPPIDLEQEREAAFEAGAAVARAEAAGQLAELEARVAAVGPLVAELERARRAALTRASEDLASLVLDLARRVVGASLAIHPEALPNLVRAAIDRLPDDDEVWVKVPPSAVERVAAVVPERHRSRVVADPSLTTGCLVETRHVAIDASLEAAAAGIAEATESWLASHR
ncbi:MAG: FliH/SctL family protein [Myxococcota bacterium]